MNPSTPTLYRVVIHVPDAEKAAAFYSELLGLRGRTVGPARTYFDCGPVILAVAAPAQQSKTPGEWDSIYLSVGNLEEIHARARELDCLAKGEALGGALGDVVKRPWGERSFYAQDPWGNFLCFVDEKTIFTGPSR